MSQPPRRWTILTVVACLVAVGWLLVVAIGAEEPLARDDFEHDLSQWLTVGPEGNVRIVPEDGTEADNHVLELVPLQGGFVHTLLRGSEGWTNVRIDGRVLFPTNGDGYLGLIYNHRRRGSRTDFGCIYVKGNGSYIRVSPHRDGNPSWRLYEELKVPLEGPRTIVPNRWYRFRLDVVGREARFAFGDLAQPLVLFDGIEMDRGAIGLEARPGRGDPVWVDDIVVRRFGAITAAGPDTRAKPVSPTLLTQWEAFGPFARPNNAVESGGEAPVPRSVVADERGMVITGRFTDFLGGDRHLAYLRTTLEGGEDGARRDLVFSTANRIDAWLDGRHLGTVEPQDYVWTDFLSTPEHVAARFPVTLSPGPNNLLLRVDGSRFAGGGFLAAVTPTTDP
jgi:hypothetical protein